jgi:Tat protein secretion system quality control protein TatD with DNase activity
VTYRDMGRPAAPVDVAGVLEAVSAIKGMPPGQVAAATTRNAESLLRLSAPEVLWR